MIGSKIFYWTVWHLSHTNFDSIVTFLDGQTHLFSLQRHVCHKVIPKVGDNFTNTMAISTNLPNVITVSQEFCKIKEFVLQCNI